MKNSAYYCTRAPPATLTPRGWGGGYSEYWLIKQDEGWDSTSVSNWENVARAALATADPGKCSAVFQKPTGSNVPADELCELVRNISVEFSDPGRLNDITGTESVFIRNTRSAPQRRSAPAFWLRLGASVCFQLLNIPLRRAAAAPVGGMLLSRLASACFWRLETSDACLFTPAVGVFCGRTDLRSAS